MVTKFTEEMINSEILSGVGKKLRNAFFNGKVSEKYILAVFNRNKQQAESFDAYGWPYFDLVQEKKSCHNPLLRKKLDQLIREHEQKTQCSVNQNGLSLKKLEFYHLTALGVGIRPVRNTLYKLGKCGDAEAEILAMLLDIEYANLMAKKRSDKKSLIYERKSILLQKASGLLYENGWKFGITSNVGKNAGWLIYIYLPDNSQLSWHVNEYTMLYYYDNIECEWDGRACSTLEKLLTFVHSKYNIGKPLVPYKAPLAA